MYECSGKKNSERCISCYTKSSLASTFRLPCFNRLLLDDKFVLLSSDGGGGGRTGLTSFEPLKALNFVV